MVDAGARALRQAAADRLAALDERGELTSDHVRLSAQTLAVAERTVWRWLAARRAGVGPVPRRRFRLDDALRVRLAYWRGNVMALHRELVAAEKAGGAPAPSKSALYRAVVADVSAGDRAGLRAGERARRRFDVFLQRPPSHRNAVWEADHVEAPVQVEADGRLVKPWVTWFVDAAHDVILGVAVTPRIPNRESVLAALRAAVMRREPYGPAGGLPAVVRIDRGKDFLSRTVADALGAFAVRVDDLPAYGAHLKGTVETINGAAEKMLFAGLPRYTHRQRQVSGAPVDPDQPPLSFEAFTAEVLGWVRWWNTEHTITELGERTPMQSWDDDPTPIHDADETRLWMFTLEDDRRRRTITTKGVAFGRGRHYVADSPGRNHTLTRLRGAQTAFERHGLPLALPPNLHYMVGVGLTTTPTTEHVITRIRACAANPAHAAALATVLFTGATYRELTFLPRRALTGDTVILPGTCGVTHPADLRVWVIPPPARPLLHAAALFQETRTVPTDRLFADVIGRTGRLHRTARACGLRIPALHPWRDGWLRSTGILNLARMFPDAVP